MTNDKKLTTQETVAAGISIAIIIVGFGYWAFQVSNVYEMLMLAYG